VIRVCIVDIVFLEISASFAVSREQPRPTSCRCRSIRAASASGKGRIPENREVTPQVEREIMTRFAGTLSRTSIRS
jgi:hypothetical protein